MAQIRCLMAGKRLGVLADIVQQLIENHLSVEVMKKVEKREMVIPLVREHQCNLVLLDFDPDEIPEICHQLLEENPTMAVAGLLEHGKRLCILIDNPRTHELTEMVRLAVQGK